jgi:predicted dehydrogenase
LRAFPELIAFRDRIRSGAFGRPLELTMVGGQHFPTYRPAYRQNHYNRGDTGGAAIQDVLTHMLNLGEWLVGPIRRLVCDAEHLALPGVDVEDTVHLLARHAPNDGAADSPEMATVLGSYALNQHQAPNETVLQVVCERGTARCELHRQRLLWMTQPGGEWQTQDFGPRERDVGYIAQAHAFLDAVENGAPVICSLAEGLQTLKVNLAALRSAQSRMWETVQ